VPRILDDDGRERRGGRRSRAPGSGQATTALLHQQQHPRGDGQPQPSEPAQETETAGTGRGYTAGSPELAVRGRGAAIRGQRACVGGGGRVRLAQIVVFAIRRGRHSGHRSAAVKAEGRGVGDVDRGGTP